LRIAEAAKAIAVTRQQLYNVINGRSAVTLGMAVRFEEAFGGGADMQRRMQAAHDLAKVRQSQKNHRAPSRAAGVIWVTLGRRSSKGSPIARR
jgi:addiction module HigA family antidote